MQKAALRYDLDEELPCLMLKWMLKRSSCQTTLELWKNCCRSSRRSDSRTVPFLPIEIAAEKLEVDRKQRSSEVPVLGSSRFLPDSSAVAVELVEPDVVEIEHVAAVAGRDAGVSVGGSAVVGCTEREVEVALSV